MSAGDTELYFELTNSVFVQDSDAPNQIPGPVFFAGDTRALLIQLVRRTSASVVEVIDLTGITIQVGIGTPAYTPTLIASATSGTVDANGFLLVSLDLATTAVQTALGTALSIVPTLEIRVIGGSNPQRYATSCALKQRLLT